MNAKYRSTTSLAEYQFRQSTSHIISEYSILHDKNHVLIIRGHKHNCDRPVFVKYFKGPSGSDRARSEFKALKCYYARMLNNSSLSVPQPYSIFLDGHGGATIICEWTSFPRGDSWFKIAMPLEFLRHYGIRQCAAWLRLYHEIGGTEMKRLDQSLDFNMLVSDFSSVASQSITLQSKKILGHELKEILLEKLSLGVKETVIHSTLHGDFTPSNIFLGPRQVVGFDFTARNTGSVLLDIGKFLSALVWYGHLGTGGRQGQKFLKDSRVFLKTYTGGGNHHSDLVVYLFLIRSLVTRAQLITSQFETASSRKLRTAHKNFAMLAEVISYLLLTLQKQPT